MRIISALVLLCGMSTANAGSSCLVHWDKAGEEAIQRLVALVQIITTAPPGNETRVVEYLEGVRAAAG
jgi:hypothetical protein